MIRATQIVANVVSALFLVGAVGFTMVETTWKSPQPATPKDYFLYGSTGTELMPLPVFQILPDLFPDQFQPGGPQAGDWVDQFGFIRGTPSVNEGLPIGMNASNFRPKSGAPTPLKFVGFNCAVCHTSTLGGSDGKPGTLILGMANPKLDLVAFGNAIQTSILDEKRLTLETITAAYQSRFHNSLGAVDKFMISQWLTGARQSLTAAFPLRDLPYGGKDIRDPKLIPSGPGRNEPMTETVRFLIDRTPPWPGGGASKIPCIYHQSWREWAQFDGSVKDPITRNSLAALGVGATLENTHTTGIFNTLQQTSVFDSTLDGPKYSDYYKTVLDKTKMARGEQVYKQYCADCHGSPGATPNQWTKGPKQGVVFPYGPLGTDDSRVTFRYYAQMPDIIFNFFPDGHPLKPPRTELRPNQGDPVGYISSPLESVFSRAPYLHNGSVPTLAELINLKPRPAVFYRGANEFDPADVGLIAPDKPDAKNYFRYDTHIRGNLNTGHDYPWKYGDPKWNKADLEALLEYMKSF